ncbi:MAG: cardiolipin synthase [Bacillota bacterium]|nr:cardiolipin synthase [Bacillota bacterium]
MTISTIFLILMYIFNITSVISIVFIRRDDTGVTLAWLLVFIFLPYIGLVLYFFFGSTYKMRRMSKKFGMTEIEELYSKNLDDQLEKILSDKIQFYDLETEKYRDMIIMNTKNAMSYYTENNTVELLTSAEEKFSRMFEDIKKATKKIDVLYFIFKTKDNIGKEFLSLLISKLNEGVEVNIIYDSLGCLKTRLKDFKKFKKSGGRVYKYLPNNISSFFNINYRMHRKMVIIDEKVAYTGGINVGDEYFGLKKINKPWRDTSIRLTGNSVLSLEIRFLADLVFLQNQTWHNFHKNKFDYEAAIQKKLSMPINTNGNVGIQILSSGPNSEYEMIKDAYIKMITSSKKYIYIQSPYFVPDRTILDSLRLAAKAGVDVRIMLPGIPDKRYVYYVTLSYLEQLLSYGIKVYLHSGFIHAKTIVMDDHVSTIGTTNMDIRSFKLDYEVNAVIYNTNFAYICRDTFLNDINDCRVLDFYSYSKRSLWTKFCESVCRFISPLA